MKVLSLSLILAFAGAATITIAIPAVAQGLGEKTAKLPVRDRVLQVLKEGLLMSGDRPFLIVGHPKLKNLADGDLINCYVRETARTFKYTDTAGAQRTVRVYQYLNERKGK